MPPGAKEFACNPSFTQPTINSTLIRTISNISVGNEGCSKGWFAVPLPSWPQHADIRDNKGFGFRGLVRIS